jgi:DNA ligase-1
MTYVRIVNPHHPHRIEGRNTMKPMLAGKLGDPELISYPVLASPKLDGIRCLIINDQAVSRNLKPIPNKVVSDILRGLPPMDGELVVGAPTDKDVFRTTSSAIMSRDGAPKFTFFVFDALTRAPMQFNQRLELAKSYAESSGKCVQFVHHKLIKSAEGLLAYEARCLLDGYEGVMVRDPNGPYKHGRSTTNEGWLLKLKRTEDSEAEVIGFQEMEHNDNVKTTDELGRSKRSSHKDGKRNAGTLGALLVKDKYSGVEFSLGTGFDESGRADVWRAIGTDRSFLGRTAKYRFLPVGVKDKPRHPVFLGWRHDDDL